MRSQRPSPSNRRGRSWTRRDVLEAGAALAVSALPLSCRIRSSRPKSLRIIQWSHFVPAYDRWFDHVFAPQWGARNGVEVIVDHMTATEVPTRGAAEAAAGKGHDLFHFLSAPAAFERQVIDHTDVVREVQKRHGPQIPLAEKSTRNPATGKFFAFSDSYVPDPGNYRIDLWSEVGFPKGPDTWDDLRVGGRKIKERFGCPVGLGFSQEIDSNMALRALLWSFGGAEQDAAGRPALDSKETVAALAFARALFQETETAEVFTWDPSSNNRAILSGRCSYVQNAISVTRTAEKEKPEMAAKIGLTPALAGPVRRMASEHLMSCYVIWKFAENPDAARQFLVDLIGAFSSVFQASEFYNLPCYPATVPDLASRLGEDAKADPRGKYGVLAKALDWSTNVGFPGYASAPIDEVFNTFVIPTMFSRVARDEATPEEAARMAGAEVRRIFARWQNARVSERRGRATSGDPRL